MPLDKDNKEALKTLGFDEDSQKELWKLDPEKANFELGMRYWNLISSNEKGTTARAQIDEAYAKVEFIFTKMTDIKGTQEFPTERHFIKFLNSSMMEQAEEKLTSDPSLARHFLSSSESITRIFTKLYPNTRQFKPLINEICKSDSLFDEFCNAINKNLSSSDDLLISIFLKTPSTQMVTALLKKDESNLNILDKSPSLMSSLIKSIRRDDIIQVVKTKTTNGYTLLSYIPIDKLNEYLKDGLLDNSLVKGALLDGKINIDNLDKLPDDIKYNLNFIQELFEANSATDDDKVHFFQKCPTEIIEEMFKSGHFKISDTAFLPESILSNESLFEEYANSLQGDDRKELIACALKDNSPLYQPLLKYAEKEYQNSKDKGDAIYKDESFLNKAKNDSPTFHYLSLGCSEEEEEVLKSLSIDFNTKDLNDAGTIKSRFFDNAQSASQKIINNDEFVQKFIEHIKWKGTSREYLTAITANNTKYNAFNNKLWKNKDFQELIKNTRGLTDYLKRIDDTTKFWDAIESFTAQTDDEDEAEDMFAYLVSDPDDPIIENNDSLTLNTLLNNSSKLAEFISVIKQADKDKDTSRLKQFVTALKKHHDSYDKLVIENKQIRDAVKECLGEEELDEIAKNIINNHDYHDEVANSSDYSRFISNTLGQEVVDRIGKFSSTKKDEKEKLENIRSTIKDMASKLSALSSTKDKIAMLKSNEFKEDFEKIKQNGDKDTVEVVEKIEKFIRESNDLTSIGMGKKALAITEAMIKTLEQNNGKISIHQLNEQDTAHSQLYNALNAKRYGFHSKSTKSQTMKDLTNPENKNPEGTHSQMPFNEMDIQQKIDFIFRKQRLKLSSDEYKNSKNDNVKTLAEEGVARISKAETSLNKLISIVGHADNLDILPESSQEKLLAALDRLNDFSSKQLEAIEEAKNNPQAASQLADAANEEEDLHFDHILPH